MIQSTDEFINILQANPTHGLLASLDVESLFTSVPVHDTIDIILQYAYENPNMSPPNIRKDIMKELLLQCTTQTPFRHVDGGIYKQREGVSMGSPLGPLFANFYMANLESVVLAELPENQRPSIYCRYVDDIFLVVNNIGILDNLKQKFEKKLCISIYF